MREAIDLLGLTDSEAQCLICEMGSWGHYDHQCDFMGPGTQLMLNCCQPLLVDAVPQEQTLSGLEQIQQIQQQLTQFNASLGEAPGPELGQSRRVIRGIGVHFLGLPLRQAGQSTGIVVWVLGALS